MKKYKSPDRKYDKLLKELAEGIDDIFEYKNVIIVGEKENHKIVKKIIDHIDNKCPGRLISINLENNHLDIVWDKSKPKRFGKKDVDAIEEIVGAKISITYDKIDHTKELRQLKKSE